MLHVLKRCYDMAFSFISYNHLLVAVQPFNVVPARAGDHQPRFLIVDIDRTAYRANCPEPVGEYVAICELHLPEMQPYVGIEEILIRCDPPPAPQSQINENKVAENKAPAFVTSSRNRLFVITLSATVVMEDAGDHRADDNRIICIFIPLSTLTPFLHRDLAESIPANKPDSEFNFRGFQNRARRDIAVSWTDWMQYGARALSVPGAELIWVCNVYGSRFVHAVEPFDAHVPRAARRMRPCTRLARGKEARTAQAAAHQQRRAQYRDQQLHPNARGHLCGGGCLEWVEIRSAEGAQRRVREYHGRTLHRL